MKYKPQLPQLLAHELFYLYYNIKSVYDCNEDILFHKNGAFVSTDNDSIFEQRCLQLQQ